MSKRNLNDYSEFNSGTAFIKLDDGREAELVKCRLWKSKDDALAEQLNKALEDVFVSYHSCVSEVADHSIKYAGLKGEVVRIKSAKFTPLPDGSVD